MMMMMFYDDDEYIHISISILIVITTLFVKDYIHLLPLFIIYLFYNQFQFNILFSITLQVAVKVHQLNPTWSEERKQSYIKHVTREYTIHRDMKHPRVVQLFDVFEIDINSFATVLEYCKGIDLDEK
jgi:serine/threonine protein kinase